VLAPVALVFAFVAQVADAGAVASGEAPGFSIAGTGAEQVVLVVTNDWRATQGAMKRMEKVGDKWMQVGPIVDVMVGDNGMGWGLGLHPLGAGEPRKLEGDSRAPAGVFRLVSALGRAPPVVKSALPFLDAAGHVCVDEPGHPGYNRIVRPDAPATSADAGVPNDGDVTGRVRPTPGIKLDPRDGTLELAVVVDHNGLGSLDEPVRKGRGSCTFLHIWKRKGRPTTGGTAMDREQLDKLVEWLDPHKKPILIQMPRTELALKRSVWGIP
jgi:L,D-peptidoglycan transpeptidase YkuD (ErfK/YbiS/YcfS/YnhG family)